MVSFRNLLLTHAELAGCLGERLLQKQNRASLRPVRLILVAGGRFEKGRGYSQCPKGALLAGSACL
jgi:hypothetical protein